MNQLKALFASLLVTGLLAAVMFVIGASAVLSRPAAPVNAASNVSAVTNNTAASSAETQQLRDLVNQYQAREKQLRAQLDDMNQQLNEKDQQLAQANDQLAQANQQIGQFQNLLEALQERGVIQITADGRIRIPAR
jgi:septal ring factor EnvC (AmiA/AmiB activator)